MGVRRNQRKEKGMLPEQAIHLAKEMVVAMIGHSEPDPTCDSVEETLERLYNKIQDLTKSE